MCAACFTGVYPIELPEAGRIGKHLFEQLPIDVEGVSIGMPGGAENALLHP